jgi:hypothetical protein
MKSARREPAEQPSCQNFEASQLMLKVPSRLRRPHFAA